MNSVAPVGDLAAGVRLPDAARQRPVLYRVSLEQPGSIELGDDVVARVRAGDERALEALFRAHYAALCEFAARYVREDALAEELVQDLFADLWGRREQWQLRGSLRGYLFSALRNRALNLRRRQALERDWERDEVADDSPGFQREPDRADDLLEREDLRARLDAAVESLPARCRIVMHLRWREQMRHAEIASIMGISLKGVEIQLARGLRALRDRLSSRRDGPHR